MNIMNIRNLESFMTLLKSVITIVKEFKFLIFIFRFPFDPIKNTRFSSGSWQ